MQNKKKYIFIIAMFFILLYTLTTYAVSYKIEKQEEIKVRALNTLEETSKYLARDGDTNIGNGGNGGNTGF